MNIGYEISISPASVAFLATIEEAMKNSAKTKTAMALIKYHSNCFEEDMVARSLLKFLENREIIRATINTQKEERAIEV